MEMSNLSRAALLATLFLALANGQSKPTISNEEAAKIVRRDIETMNIMADPIGKLSVIRQSPVKPKADYSQGEINPSDFKELQLLAKLGVVKISQSQDLSKEFTNWNDWFAMTQQGVAVRIAVTRTPAIKDYPQCSSSQRTWVEKNFNLGKQDFVCFPVGELTVDKIVSNEIRTVGADHYAIVMGTYSQELTPAMKSFFALAGQTPASQKKFVTALKFDPFTDGWVIKALDQADRQQEFKTENVNRLLAAPIR